MLNLRGFVRGGLFCTLGMVSCVFGASFTAFMKERGYRATLHESGHGVVYNKESLSVTLHEYSPLVKIGGSTYFLEGTPRIGVMGMVLDAKDMNRLLKWLSHHENKQDERLNKLPKKDIKIPSSTPKKHPFPNMKGRPSYRLNKIILDAGHGGNDPGASAYGFLEKDLTLEITKDLKNSLKEVGVQAAILMTRTKDVYLSLEKRCHLANNALKRGENGLFISLHLNRWFHKKTRGFETYYLAHSTNVMNARITSHVEDTQFDLNRTNWKGLDPFQVIFSRLEIVQYQKESKHLAQTIGHYLHREVSPHEMHIRGVKSELFYVLKGTLMPAILIEVGFISNKKDVEFLTDNRKRRHLTTLIARGILRYEEQFNRTRGFSLRLFTPKP